MLSIQYNVPASKISWFRTGGIIEELITINSIEELSYFIKNYNNKNYHILGACSNTLIGDKGLKCAVRLQINQIKLETNYIYAQAGLLTTKFIRYCIENQCGGLEFMHTIPGKIGGLIRMNAGAYGVEIKNVIQKIEIMNTNGEIYYMSADEMNFHYRQSTLSDKHIIVGGFFSYTHTLSETIQQSLEALQNKRKQTQPLKNKSLGSVFKNPKNVILTQAQLEKLSNNNIFPSLNDNNKYDLFVGQLIESCKLKGLTHGGACISTIHANFIENINNATSNDYISLINIIKTKIYDTYQISLDLENKILED